MSDIRQEIKMLYYLIENNNNANMVKGSELASLLNVTERQIRRYKTDLEEKGFEFSSVKGQNGGIILDSNIPSILSLNDTLLIESHVSDEEDELMNVLSLSKVIKNNMLTANDNFETLSIDNLIGIAKGIKESKAISFKYRNPENIIEVEPYTIVNEKGSYFLAGINKGKLKRYLIRDIKDIVLTDNSFERNNEIAKEIRFDYKIFGHKNKMEERKVTLELLEFTRDLEKSFDYKGERNENIYTLYTYSFEDVLDVIMSYGHKIKILEPVDLIELYKEELRKIDSLYSEE